MGVAVAGHRLTVGHKDRQDIDVWALQDMATKNLDAQFNCCSTEIDMRTVYH